MSILNSKLNWLFKKKCTAQKRLYEAETEMDIRNREPRYADIALCETNRELESQRLELYQAGSEKKMNLFGDLEMRNRIFQENRGRNCQNIGFTRNLLRRNRQSQTIEN